MARALDSKVGDILSNEVAGSTTITVGTIVMETAGYAIPGADTAGGRFLGIAIETVDNSAGSAGDKRVRYQRTGVVKMAATGLAVTDNQALVYANGASAVALSTTNSVRVGRIVEYISATEAWVELSVG